MANGVSFKNFEDPSHHLFFHHSNHPGDVLVSQLLTKDNYQTWNQAIVMALGAKNKLGFVDGSIYSSVSTHLAKYQE